LVKAVARVENQQSDQASTISNLTILMLAALNIANEHMELKRHHKKLLRDISERSENLIQTLNRSTQ
jgi:cell division protein ZapA (FtsZ GTPase activity inhibitor)